MAKIRSVSPSACISPDLAAVSDRAALMFLLLPCHCDDYGVMPYHPAKLKALVFPMRDVTADECALLVDELSAHDMVSVYEAEGASWLHVTNFSKYQHPARMRRSDWPLPPSPAEEQGQCSDSAEAVREQCRDSAEAVQEQCAGSAEAVRGQCGDSAEGAECAEKGASHDNRQCSDSAATVQGQCGDSAEAVPRQCSEAAGEGEGEGDRERKEKQEKEKRAAEPPEPSVFDVAEPSDEDVRRVVSCINRVARKRLSADTPSVREPIAIRLAQGRTVDELCSVATCKARQWAGWEQAKARLVPKTLFGRKFDEYLADAEEGGGSDAEDERYSGAW